MKTLFAIPHTRLVRVLFNRNGVTYAATIERPQTYDALLCVMLSRKVGASQIRNVQAVNEIKRN